MEEPTSMEDRINLHQLMELKAAFERADTDQGGSLDMEEFLEAFGGVLGENLTTTQLIHLFMKIDANSDGSVDWDEFTQFMLLENQAAADMSDRSFAVRYICLAGVLGDSPRWALHDRTTFTPVPQEPRRREPPTRPRPPAAVATVARGGDDAEDADSEGSGSEEDDGSSDAEQPDGARVELNIAQILSRTTRRALHAPATMHRLKIHELRAI
jgi:hypothetical protein